MVAVAAVLALLAAPAAAGGGAVRGTATDANAPALGEIDYLFNRAGYHLWFTATDDLGPYIEGHSYHNVYKYDVDDPTNWCVGAVPTPNRLPYNAGGTAGSSYYYTSYDVTSGTYLCGSAGA